MNPALCTIGSSAAVIAGAATLVFFGTFLPSGWPLVILGYAALFYDLLYRTHSALRALVRGALVGFASGGAGVIWMWDMLPLPVPGGLSPLTGVIVTVLVWGVTALLAATTTAAAAFLFWKLRTSPFAAPLAGILFVIESLLRMWAYALYSYSPQSLFGPHFSQTAPGYALADNGYLLQLAYPFGIFALTFALAAFAVGAASVLRFALTRAVTLQAAVSCIFFGALLLYPFLTPAKEGETRTSVAAIALGATDADGHTARALLERAAASGAEVVLLPEGSDLRKLFPERPPQEPLERMFEGRDALILSSGYVEGQAGDSYARIEYFSTLRGSLGEYRKLFLMPQAEYYPLIARPLFALAGDARMNEHLTGTGRRLVRGESLTAADFEEIAVGGLLCSEIMSPFLYESLAQDSGADILANLADPSWFHSSRSLYEKTRQIARTHAAATRRPFVLSSTDAPALIIDARGDIIAESSWGVPEVLTAEVSY